MIISQHDGARSGDGPGYDGAGDHYAMIRVVLRRGLGGCTPMGRWEVENVLDGVRFREIVPTICAVLRRASASEGEEDDDDDEEEEDADGLATARIAAASGDDSP